MDAFRIADTYYTYTWMNVYIVNIYNEFEERSSTTVMHTKLEWKQSPENK